MKSKFEDFLEKLNLEDNLKLSIKNGFDSILESMSSTSSSTGYNTIAQTDSTGTIHYVPDPSGYNGGHNTVDDDFDANEGEEKLFEFKLPGLVDQAESDVQDIKDKFKSFLTKLHSIGDKKNLTEAILKAIDVLFEDLSSSGYGMGMAAYDYSNDDNELDAKDVGPVHHHHGLGSNHTHLKNKKKNKTNIKLHNNKFNFVLNSLTHKYSK